MHIQLKVASFPSLPTFPELIWARKRARPPPQCSLKEEAQRQLLRAEVPRRETCSSRGRVTTVEGSAAACYRNSQAVEVRPCEKNEIGKGEKEKKKKGRSANVQSYVSLPTSLSPSFSSAARHFSSPRNRRPGSGQTEGNGVYVRPVWP